MFVPVLTNHQIRMISEGSCDTEEHSATTTGIHDT